MKLCIFMFGLVFVMFVVCGGGNGGVQDSQVLNVYNYSDYIVEDIILIFEKESGIKVIYDVFDSDEMVEIKLLVGNSGYDVVVLILNFFGCQIQVGVFLLLDKSKILNLVNFDLVVMKCIVIQDLGNQYGVLYMIGIIGIGYNVDMLKQCFGGSIDIVNSWDLVFKLENISKMKDCGVIILDMLVDMILIVLYYLGLDLYSGDLVELQKVVDLLKLICLYVQNFYFLQYVGLLVNGGICLVVGWFGDIIQVCDCVEEVSNGVYVVYLILKEGVLQWFDMLVILKDVKYLEVVYRFINYLLELKVVVVNINFIYYVNLILIVMLLVDEVICIDLIIYLLVDVVEKMFIYLINMLEIDKFYIWLWIEVKIGC